MSLDNVRIVLVRPQGSANVGAVARAMKNMGLRDLVLVQPRLANDGWAEAMAVHARDLLDSARTVDSLDEAIAGCGLVVATAARSGPFRGQTSSPREGAAELVSLSQQAPVAVVFGPEDHGLSNEDLKPCQRVWTIPTAGDYSSLNLAQAVLLCAYELHLAAVERRGRRPEATDVVPATAERIGFLLQRLEGVLSAIGFLNPQNPEPVMFVFRRIFARAGLVEHDVSVLLGMARQIEWLANSRRSESSEA